MPSARRCNRASSTDGLNLALKAFAIDLGGLMTGSLRSFSEDLCSGDSSSCSDYPELLASEMEGYWGGLTGEVTLLGVSVFCLRSFKTLSDLDFSFLNVSDRR